MLPKRKKSISHRSTSSATRTSWNAINSPSQPATAAASAQSQQSDDNSDYVMAMETVDEAVRNFDRPVSPAQASDLADSAHVDTTRLHFDDEDDLFRKEVNVRSSRRPSQRVTRKESDEDVDAEEDDAFDGDEYDKKSVAARSSTHGHRKKQTRPSTRYDAMDIDESDSESEEDENDDSDPILVSDVLPRASRRRRQEKSSRSRRAATIRGDSSNARRSRRSNMYARSMKEVAADDIYRSSSSEDSSAKKPAKMTAIREVFPALPPNDVFRNRHMQQCDTCGHGLSTAPLIYCQGCCLAYHKSCLGNRTSREHLVTKVGDETFVVQCRRCVNAARRKDATAPDQAMCQDCRSVNPSSRPFRARKTPAQEQKEREDNGGDDPVVPVKPELIDNVRNVLFRCAVCYRAYHFLHLPARTSSGYDEGDEEDEGELANERFNQYNDDWQCALCEEKPGKVSSLIAWRPADEMTYEARRAADEVDEDLKEYLIKWEHRSYFQARWMPGAWVWATTAPGTRKAFFKKAQAPCMRAEDAIPEDFLRIDIVLDVKYTSYVEIRTEEVDKARIKEVDEAYLKFKGLGYEDAVWEKVPTPEDGDRWTDFVIAYDDWVLGRYVHVPKPSPLKKRLENVRAQPFSKLEKKKQPENLDGGQLMKYQMEGLNWLYYQWYAKKNGILADEMGLGKTVQIIGFMATLVQDYNCFPFLVVVPNSTCANWRRELKQWAPSLRIVTYFGSAMAREKAYRYEMFPEGSKDLRCHVVVTSYDAAGDENCRRFFRSVSWVGLIVDEGHRLKSDSSQLYTALSGFKVPFRVLMTGTPLQNNARELFNLLQFLDDDIQAERLEQEYQDLTKEKIAELHDLIRPFILRRTKAAQLSFLPPMAQIIVPLSMSVLQKKLYKSILAKNQQLLRAIFTTKHTLKQQERANLSNLLMQLRKCLCHPFVYSREIEERSDVQAISHRNLVEASAKLQLLDIMLPKLKERGHRVLIFSQFLDMLDIVEDFLDGLEMRFQRLDGRMGSLEKQKRIDEFNAPNSPLFAFLLSTRAGGVGINLATADTVIIMDPDFNPHQDIQALSRAHRIGQKKKVLCFQFMTRASAEEKIVQIGRKKMALDHVVVETLDEENSDEKDLESILKHGAAELFKDTADDHDIKYDATSVDKLLDRSQMENTKSDADNTAESQFSFARVWANEQGALTDDLPENAPEADQAPDLDVWDKILKEREKAAAEEAARREQLLGRGKRARMNVDYSLGPGIEGVDFSPSSKDQKRRKVDGSEDSDTDFQVEGEPPEDDEMSGVEDNKLDRLDNLSPAQSNSNQQASNSGVKARGVLGHQPPTTPRPFSRAKVPTVSEPPMPGHPHQPLYQACPACSTHHAPGSCPLKLAGPEYCNLCDTAHYGGTGQTRNCPHLQSETQVRAMIDAVNSSPEAPELRDAAAKYLRGAKGSIVQAKKRKHERDQTERMATAAGAPPPAAGASRTGYPGAGRPPSGIPTNAPSPAPAAGPSAGSGMANTANQRPPSFAQPRHKNAPFQQMQDPIIPFGVQHGPNPANTHQHYPLQQQQPRRVPPMSFPRPLSTAPAYPNYAQQPQQYHGYVQQAFPLPSQQPDRNFPSFVTNAPGPGSFVPPPSGGAMRRSTPAPAPLSAPAQVQQPTPLPLVGPNPGQLTQPGPTRQQMQPQFQQPMGQPGLDRQQLQLQSRERIAQPNRHEELDPTHSIWLRYAEHLARWDYELLKRDNAEAVHQRQRLMQDQIHLQQLRRQLEQDHAEMLRQPVQQSPVIPGPGEMTGFGHPQPQPQSQQLPPKFDRLLRKMHEIDRRRAEYKRHQLRIQHVRQRLEGDGMEMQQLRRRLEQAHAEMPPKLAQQAPFLPGPGEMTGFGPPQLAHGFQGLHHHHQQSQAPQEQQPPRTPQQVQAPRESHIPDGAVVVDLCSSPEPEEPTAGPELGTQEARSTAPIPPTRTTSSNGNYLANALPQQQPQRDEQQARVAGAGAALHRVTGMTDDAAVDAGFVSGLAGASSSGYIVQGGAQTDAGAEESMNVDDSGADTEEKKDVDGGAGAA
ncbi:hypothetical protein BDY21DRAFT_378523 [Lineolata rhizophorae]|uniref:PHD/FYVE-zinc-finger like domain-containing protein n=1 Tax=Lineolata rhizophorae TaxID=578093 RepID=A0A6A6P4H1_9PEZI|nr:hypothetical protein BDY21DRAFT_378523 [Lineolata rhizophorae]